ncbi:MAG TPA: aminotransferase class V-fold PLP-dependent enzyme [Ktedonobacteraceae bacterium]
MQDRFDLTLSQDLETFRQLGYRAVDIATSYLVGVRERPVFQPMTPAERQKLLDAALPEEGTAPDSLLDSIAEQIFTHPMGNGHPRFFAWVNSPPAALGTIADFLAAVLDPSCAGGDHAAIYLEHMTIRWLMELLDFPTDGSYGLLVSGGSMATLTGLAAARQWAASQDGWDIRATGLQGQHARLVLYTSVEGHSCIRKSVELLGLGSEALRIIPTDEFFRIDMDALRSAIQADRVAGLRPFCICASVGTTNTGSIDPLDKLADLCAQEDLWLHIDGAYGALGKLDPGIKPALAGLERADSLALDPHKWLSVPVECGCILVRDGKLLRETFSLVPAYLQMEEGRGIAGLPWFSEYGFQQTRGFRALKLWSVLQSLGRQGLEQRISHHNALARHLAALLDAAPDFERLAPVSLSIVCFRYTPADLQNNAEAIEQLNRSLVPLIQESGEAFLTGTVLRATFCLRVCILHDATTTEDIAALLEIVRRLAARSNPS